MSGKGPPASRLRALEAPGSPRWTGMGWTRAPGKPSAGVSVRGPSSLLPPPALQFPEGRLAWRPGWSWPDRQVLELSWSGGGACEVRRAPAWLRPFPPADQRDDITRVRAPACMGCCLEAGTAGLQDFLGRPGLLLRSSPESCSGPLGLCFGVLEPAPEYSDVQVWGSVLAPETIPGAGGRAFLPTRPAQAAPWF